MRQLLFLSCVVLASIAPSFGQADPPVFEFTESIDFERPEAWALARGASLLQPHTTSPRESSRLGAIEIGLELLQDPHLTSEQRRVGFIGAKVEDINRLAVVPRPSVTVGLGRGFRAFVAYLPPVTVEGLEPNVLTVAIDKSFTWERSFFALRAQLQDGRLRGDITCPDGVSAIPAGMPGNESGCEGRSMDEATLDALGIGATFGWRLGRVSPVLGLTVSELDLAFQVDALTFGFRDRMRMITDGTVTSVDVGVDVDLGRSSRFSLRVVHTPLDRSESSGQVRSEPLTQARIGLSLRL